MGDSCPCKELPRCVRKLQPMYDRKSDDLMHKTPGTLLNKRTEFLNKCRHRNNYMLKNVKHRPAKKFKPTGNGPGDSAMLDADA